MGRVAILFRLTHHISGARPSLLPALVGTQMEPQTKMQLGPLTVAAEKILLSFEGLDWLRG